MNPPSFQRLLPTFRARIRPAPVQSLAFLLALAAAMGGGTARADTVLWSPSATAAWTADARSPAARPGPRHTALPSPFAASPQADRFTWNLPGTFDLSGVTRIRIDLAADRPAAVRRLLFYLRSGAGWYVASVEIPDGADPRPVHLSRSAFQTEGTPAGWDRISGLRLSPFRGDGTSADLRLASVTAHRDPIRVLIPTDPFAARSAERMLGLFHRHGLPAGGLREADATPGDLAGAALLVLSGNERPDPGLADRVASHIRAGGRVIGAGPLPSSLAPALGLRAQPFVARPTLRHFHGYRFNAAAPPGVPTEVVENAWGLTPVQPATPAGRVIAHWLDDRGDPSPTHPAVVLTSQAAWITFPVLAGDPEAKADLLEALALHLAPSLWPAAARAALEKAERFHTFASFETAVQTLDRTVQALDGDRQAVGLVLASARRHHAAARTGLARRDWAEAHRQARAARLQLRRANAMAQPAPPADEFRGIWDHQGWGLRPGAWDETFAALRRAGITAYFPDLVNARESKMPLAGLAAHRLMQQEGDMLTPALAAARRAGIEVHVWKICWSLMTPQEAPPPGWDPKLLQQRRDGSPLGWLNPVVPENREREMAAILEIARRYPVDGIHLDYHRYPGPDADFSPATRAAFERARGRRAATWPPDLNDGSAESRAFIAWRAEVLTGFLRELRPRLRAVRPDLVLSAAVWAEYPAGVRSVGQDWGAWLREDLVDKVFPMTYMADLEGFRREMARQQAMPRARGRVIPGLGLTAGRVQLTPEQMFDQIAAARAAGAPGFALFSLDPAAARDVFPLLGARAGP